MPGSAMLGKSRTPVRPGRSPTSSLTSGFLCLLGEFAQRGGEAGGRRRLDGQSAVGGGAAIGHQRAIERGRGEGADGGCGPGRCREHS